MSEQLTVLLGLPGVRVLSMRARGDELELSLELSSVPHGCPRCASTSIELKERALVRVRDLAIGARRTTLAWRKRRYRCRGCRRSFSEAHAELPTRQRVSARFRRELFRYVCGGAAHLEVARLEQTSRYQVVRAFKLGSERLLANQARLPAPALYRRGCAPARLEAAGDGRLRPRPRLRRGGARGPRPAHARALPARAARAAAASARGGLDRPCFRLPRGVAGGAARGGDRGRPLPPRPRRQPRPRHGPARAPTLPPPRPAGQQRAARRRLPPPPLARAPAPAQRQGTTHRKTTPRALPALPARAAARRGLGAEGRFRAIYRSHGREQAEHRLELFLNAAERAQIPSFLAFANELRDWQQELLAYFDQPTSNGYAEGVINKIKVIKRRAYGLPSFNSFRTRILIACG